VNSLPLISIISVNFNEPEETTLFLDSIYESNYANFEVIIIDNGSTRKVNPEIVDQYPRLKFIQSEKNKGFAGGNNLGIIQSHGDYLLFLNNDTLVPPDFITKIVDFMERTPEAGIASPKIIYPNGLIQYAGSIPINPYTGRGKRIGKFQEDIGQFDGVCETGLPHGAAMIVQRKAIEKAGLIPEDYFLYYEECDWGHQIQSFGYKLYYVGETYIIHKESLSVGKDSPLKVYYMNRNRLLYLMRNYKGFTLFSGVIFYVLFAFPKSSAVYLFSGKFKHLKSLWRGVLWHLNKKFVYEA
jgi:GT2 family glycosyltransferase